MGRRVRATDGPPAAGAGADTLLLLGDELIVVVGGEKGGELGGVGEGELHHPGRVGVAVDLLGRGGQIIVDGGDRAGDWERKGR